MPIPNTQQTLSSILGYSWAKLESITKRLDDHYSFYERLEVKANGKEKRRKIEPVREPLKTVQSRILRRILSDMPLLDCAHGSIKGRDSITNALAHMGKNFHFCTDIKKFYPSVRHEMVDAMLYQEGITNLQVKRMLRLLMTYKGRLPQGSPTSAYAANLVFKGIDKELMALCQSRGIQYTRYLDDLVFSAQSCFTDLTPALIQAFESRGFRRSNRKTFYKQGPAEVTGVLVRQNEIDLTDQKKRKLLNEQLTEQQRQGFENYARQVLRYGKY